MEQVAGNQQHLTPRNYVLDNKKYLGYNRYSMQYLYDSSRQRQRAHFGAREDSELVLLVQSGVPDALETLMGRYRSKLIHLTRTVFWQCQEYDDAFQDASIAFYRAALSYDPSAGSSFFSFAEMCVQRHLLSARRKVLKRREAPWGELDDTQAFRHRTRTENRLVDQLTSSLDERNRWVKRASRLTPLEGRVLQFYLAGMTYHEMSSLLGCKEKRIDNAIQRIKRKFGQIAAIS